MKPQHSQKIHNISLNTKVMKPQHSQKIHNISLNTKLNQAYIQSIYV